MVHGDHRSSQYVGGMDTAGMARPDNIDDEIGQERVLHALRSDELGHDDPRGFERKIHEGSILDDDGDYINRESHIINRRN